MSRLLVSVRSAAEAESALRGGASLIDVKEPRRGSLGRAEDAIIAEVVHRVAGRRPVSAAFGEWRDVRGGMLPIVPSSLAYGKWGLAGCRGHSAWQMEMSAAMRRLSEQSPNYRAVAAAYADWRRAKSPPLEEVCAFAIEHAAGALLLDTWRKDGATLLDWLTRDEIEHLCQDCRAARLPIALAGSLGFEEIRTLLPMRPDWFAVRGAVCHRGRRGAAIEEGRVRQLVDAITPARSAS